MKLIRQSIDSKTAYSNRYKVGLVFPVFHPGGLLFFGDGHALQGDGEPSGTGIETSLDIDFTVAVRKNARLTGPRLENREYIISIGSQPEFHSNLDQALRTATVDKKSGDRLRCPKRGLHVGSVTRHRISATL